MGRITPPKLYGGTHFGMQFVRTLKGSLSVGTSVTRLIPEALKRDQPGALLLEALIAVTVFTSVAVAALAGVSGFQRAKAVIETQAEVENIARNQMEYAFYQTYLVPDVTPPLTWVYYTSTTTTSPYTVTAGATSTSAFPTDDQVQQIVVTVMKGAKVELVVETLRTNK